MPIELDLRLPFDLGKFCFFVQRGEPERTLTDSQRDEFEDMLRALTLERSQIKDAMGFSLDNADAASEVCNLCWFVCVQKAGRTLWIKLAFSILDLVQGKFIRRTVSRTCDETVTKGFAALTVL